MYLKTLKKYNLITERIQKKTKQKKNILEIRISILGIINFLYIKNHNKCMRKVRKEYIISFG